MWQLSTGKVFLLLRTKAEGKRNDGLGLYPSQELEDRGDGKTSDAHVSVLLAFIYGMVIYRSYNNMMVGLLLCGWSSNAKTVYFFCCCFHCRFIS